MLFTAQEELRFLAQYADKLNIHLPSLLAFALSLFAIVAGSKTGIRFWIALNQAPFPTAANLPPNSTLNEEPVKKPRKYRDFLLRRILPVFIGVMIGISVPSHGSIGLLIFVPFLLLSSFSLLSYPTGWVTVTAHRLKSGRPALLSVPGEGSRRKVFLASIIIVALALSTKWMAFAWFVFTATAFRFSMGTAEKSRSFGWTFIPRAIIGLFMFAFGTVIVAVIASRKERAFTAYVKFTEAWNDSLTPGVSSFSGQWLAPSMMIGMTGTVIALALRFDYHNHLVSQDTDYSSAHPDLEIRPYVSKLKLNIAGNGVVLPSNAPRRFKKSYYRSTLGAWVVTNTLLLVAMSYARNTSFKDYVEATPVSMLIAYVAAPISLISVYVALCLTAIIRGEFKHMARYHEAWQIRMTDPEQLLQEEPAQEEGKFMEVKEKLEGLIMI